jgi:hypothetical protein
MGASTSLLSVVLCVVSLFIGFACPAKDVAVKGYTTKNGTHVQPHMRSAPDGSKANNYSTKGNVNPHTGKPGTRALVPSGSVAPFGGTAAISQMPTIRPDPPLPEQPAIDSAEFEPEPPRAKKAKPNLEEAIDKMRMHRADVIKDLGHDVDWSKHSSAELLDIELRIRAAKALKALDYDASWQVETLDSLLDKHARIEKARELERKGVEVNWTKMTLDQLNDYTARIRKAEALKQLGKSVDWQKHTLKQLTEMQAQVLHWRAR